MTRSGASHNAGKRHGVASRVPAEKDGFAERLLAITAHQDVTYFTDRTRCLVLVLLRPASPKSSVPPWGVHTPRGESLERGPLLAIPLSVTIHEGGFL